MPEHRNAAHAPAPKPEPGWEDLDELQERLADASFVSGDPGGDRLRVRYYRRTIDGAVVGRAWFGPGALGPPDHAHGGSMAAVLDEAMGITAWLAGYRAVAANLSVDFRRLLPLGTDATFCCWVDGIDGKKVELRGQLTGPAGEVYAESRGLFVVVDEQTAEDFRVKWQRHQEAKARGEQP